MQLRELRGQIRTQSPRYAALTDPQPLSMAALQRDVLDDETVLLTYALGAEGAFCGRYGTQPYELRAPGEKSVEAAARRVHHLLTVSHRRQRRREAERAVAELARMLLWPAKHQLTARRVAIVADGALQFVPFAALPSMLSRSSGVVRSSTCRPPPLGGGAAGNSGSAARAQIRRAIRRSGVQS